MLNAPRMFITFESKIFVIFCSFSGSFSFQTVSLSSLDPFLYSSCIEPHRYQLRVYAYQARDLIPSDSSGLSGKSLHRNV